MEENTKNRLTALQQNPDDIKELRALVHRIGVNWVAQAAGISDQTVTNFINCRPGTLKTQLSILQSLKRAIELKKLHFSREADSAVKLADTYVGRTLADMNRMQKCAGVTWHRVSVQV